MFSSVVHLFAILLSAVFLLSFRCLRHHQLPLPILHRFVSRSFYCKDVLHLLQTLFLTEKVGQKVSKKKKCLSCVTAFFVWSSSSFGNRSRTDTMMCLLFSSASQRKCVCLAAFSSILFEFINFLLFKLLLFFCSKTAVPVLIC